MDSAPNSQMHLSREDMARFEDKLDRLSEAINRLVLIEERQSNQANRVEKLENRVGDVEDAQSATNRKLDAWVNRGIGIWLVVSLLATVFWKISLL